MCHLIWVYLIASLIRLINWYINKLICYFETNFFMFSIYSFSFLWKLGSFCDYRKYNFSLRHSIKKKIGPSSTNERTLGFNQYFKSAGNPIISFLCWFYTAFHKFRSLRPIRITQNRYVFKFGLINLFSTINHSGWFHEIELDLSFK